MKFSEYLSESAIVISDDMKKYTETVIKKILEIIKKHVTYAYFQKENHRKNVLHKNVDSKYGNYGISTFLLTYYTENSSNAYATDFEIFLTIRKEDYEKLKENDSKEIENLRVTILHELVHIVDPKFRMKGGEQKTKTAISKNNKILDLYRQQLSQTESPEKIKEIRTEISKFIKAYYKFPWEIDAYISSQAEVEAEAIIKKSKNIHAALTYVKNYVPKGQAETFYHEEPEIWKRFILHLTKLIHKGFEKDAI